MFYLASQSPRRKELLTQLGINFDLIDASIDEQKLNDEDAITFVRRMAKEKAIAGWNVLNTPSSEDMVLGSDTVVVYQEEVLGKPIDPADSFRMLKMLSNKQHKVITAIAIATKDKTFVEHVSTTVWFREISNVEIEEYWRSGEPQDKAGSYGIQGLAGKFVKSITGSYFAVVGLPLYETEQLIVSAQKELNNKGIE